MAYDASAQGVTSVVVLSNSPSPDGNGAFRSGPSSRLSPPTLSNARGAGFTTLLENTSEGFNDDEAVFKLQGGALIQLAREGKLAPNGDGNLHFFTNVGFNHSGEAAFGSRLINTSGGAASDRGIFRGDGQALVEIVREGDAPPDGNGFFADASTFSAFGSPLLNGAGEVAFSGRLTGTSNGAVDDAGIFRGDGNSLVQIAREHQLAPDGNGRYSQFGNYAVNDLGQVAFEGTLSGTDEGVKDFQGIFRGNGGEVTQIARANQFAPDGTTLLAYFHFPVVNNAGQVAFVAVQDTLTSSKESLFRGDGDELTLIAGYGSAAPDGNGQFFNFNTPAMNDAGVTAFHGALQLTTPQAAYTGIFRGDGGELTQIARGGQSAPGGGGKFDLRFDPVINEAGQVAFYSYLSDGGSGIYFFDDATGLQLVARVGTSLLGSTIARVGFTDPGVVSAPLRTRFSGLNDQGQIAFSFTLQDGRSGIAVWSVPEPTASILCILAAVSGTACRARKYRA